MDRSHGLADGGQRDRRDRLRAGTPEATGRKSASRRPLYTADLAFQLPYDNGEVRESVLRGFTTIGPPAPGKEVDLYYASAHPEIAVRSTPPGPGALTAVLYTAVGSPPSSSGPGC